MLAQDHPRLLSVIAGACAAAGANIVDAQIFTTTRRPRARHHPDLAASSTATRTSAAAPSASAELIEDVLSGKIRLPEMIAQARQAEARRQGLHASSRDVMIDNALSNSSR